MLNVNIGLLGHVDSGKTALAKALSCTASTAAFDKSPQSQSRGITLDLGFSACEVSRDDGDDAREVLAESQLEKVQCTLVDCPGHASLIRTVVGGAQIIDAMVLVIDATKGMQAQTAECLVLGEVLAKPLVVVVNKIDAVQGGTSADKAAALATLRRKLQQTFRRTRWPTVAVVEVAAAPREANGGIGAARNVDAVLPQVLRSVDLAALKATKEREGERPERFYMLADHCFAVRGQGTVFTGTVAAGMVRVGDTILVPELQTTRKVKGLQVFHTPVESARSGDRVGLCVAQFDPTSFERGVLCSTAGSERTLVSTSQLIARVHKVRYHPLPCDTHTKFHITIGHATVMGTMRYFARPRAATTTSSAAPPLPSSSTTAHEVNDAFDPMVESAWVEELDEDAVASYAAVDGDSSSSSPAVAAGRPSPVVPGAREYYAVLLLERPVLAAAGNSMVAMRLDVERENFCRIALAGTVCYTFAGDGGDSNVTTQADGDTAAWRRLPVVRYTSRTLRVDRVLDSRSCIADGVVSLAGHSNVSGAATPADAGKLGNNKSGKAPAESRPKSELFGEVQKFIRLKVLFEDGGDAGGTAEESLEEKDATSAPERPHAAGSVMGIVDSTFGKTGKVKLVFEAPVFADPSTATKGSSGGVAGGAKRKKKTGDRGDDGEEAMRDGFLRPGRILLILKKSPFALHSALDQ
ncbi:putative selenocysteine-specific elongation factor [Leptomonas pyrrhocoris]|uniref:Putative selenocysteine-specific elongation factor n=1 Tax=Leptomonas pyrrhocoris TaxID=157538 RepID=A0A0M9G567_LEPPY|nr:putative selenocysteine-specific elongation factor [Leptomonas pyrrhocoris]KPA82359.1 putative selenocysteine-specific elongation factor [Leptomonas pyrrhocoris]|eukprot:XP_015660798.1 putative selenocysteine-specific elongation factor [Leptomonas pyrrhocoris]